MNSLSGGGKTRFALTSVVLAQKCTIPPSSTLHVRQSPKRDWGRVTCPQAKKRMSLSLFGSILWGRSSLSEKRKLWGGLPQNLPTELYVRGEVFVILSMTQPTWVARYAWRRRFVYYLIDMAALGLVSWRFANSECSFCTLLVPKGTPFLPV